VKMKYRQLLWRLFKKFNQVSKVGITELVNGMCQWHHLLLMPNEFIMGIQPYLL